MRFKSITVFNIIQVLKCIHWLSTEKFFTEWAVVVGILNFDLAPKGQMVFFEFRSGSHFLDL